MNIELQPNPGMLSTSASDVSDGMLDERNMKSEDDTKSQYEDERLYNGVYYFESDHAALKGNDDYNNMLKTIALLETQRMKALRDLDTLHDKYRESVENPIAFVDKLQRKIDLDLPKRQKIANVPRVDWNKYTKNASFESLVLNKRMTRWKSQIEDGIISDTKSVISAVSTSQKLDESGESKALIRGRVKHEGKTETFNKLWSVEEQQKLERLLVENPEEEVEAQRFAKIAKALGTRSQQQVASRIQKYFIKLAKAGLSIPGRVPALYNHAKKSQHRHQRYHRFYHTPSTFLASHEPPVYMSDGEDSQHAPSMSRDSPVPPDMPDVSDDEDIPSDLHLTHEYARLMCLKRLKRKHLHLAQTLHHGYSCDSCGMEPIMGPLWHCIDCPTERSVDFCQTCAQSGYETASHNLSHLLKLLKPQDASRVIDSDYTQFQPHGYNYLDPNFMPAT